MRSTIQEETLLRKTAFERWAATFGVKINRYHAENERFSEQPFRSEIDSEHTITFCGFVSHHKNAISERKIQTLTIGDRTSIQHANIYWTEEIPTMLWTYSPKDFS